MNSCAVVDLTRCFFLMMVTYSLVDLLAIGIHGQEEKIVFPPKIIPSLIKSVSSVVSHSICLGYDGNVYTFGSNAFGQLGICADNFYHLLISTKS